MPLSAADRSVLENTSAVYTATLKDQDGVVIAAGSLDALTLTLYNDKDGTIINSRSQQNCLNANNVTVDSSGGLIWVMQPADNVIVDTALEPGQTEVHKGLFEWTWDTTRKGRHELQIDVTQVDEVTLSTGTTLVSSWGGGTSNTYLGYTAANSFIVHGIVEHGAWNSASAAERAAALIEATRDIDSRQYIFTKYTSIQVLEFPRQLSGSWPDSLGQWDATSLSYLEARMQRDVEQACAHQALFRLYKKAKSAHQLLQDAGVSRVRRKLGPIDEEFHYALSSNEVSRPGSSRNPLCPETMALLADWMTTKKVYRG